jgi:hypothetical protein
MSDDDGLRVVGAYPRGQSHFDLKRAGHAVPKVALPETDGEDGPLKQIWTDQ